MLSRINTVGSWFKNDSDNKELENNRYNNQWLNGFMFDDITFDDEVKKAFNQLPIDIEMFDQHALVTINNKKTKTTNQCYIPSQYFLYAVKLQPLVVLLNNYMRLFSQVKNSVPTASDFENLINTQQPSNHVLNTLDSHSKANFISAFKDSSNRMGGKNIINDGKTKGKKYRSESDFMSSILLQAIPVPNASSDLLGQLLYAFSQAPLAYAILMENYSTSVPYLFKAENGDELIVQILSTLGWQGLLDSYFSKDSDRYSDWGTVDKAFLFSGSQESGNSQYVEVPIHHSSLYKYVYIKKGLLDTDELVEVVSDLVSVHWKNMSIQKENGEFFFRSSLRFDDTSPAFTGATNKIFYGAPGTGKSHHIHNVECEGADTIVTVFHPDTQYGDFVGALKPNMATDENGKSNVAYQFRQGPFTKALIEAKSHPSKHICLIIEEINRAPAAAVFGELFQLLDRDKNGQSTYKIDASDPDMLMHINEQLSSVGAPELLQLEIPANLSILATMNSSDQAVMPMDAAFKRRWSFQYIDIDFSNPDVPNHNFQIATSDGEYNIFWAELAKIINDALIDCNVAEDRLIGPFFLTKREMKNSLTAKETLNGKLFVYLWDDVLRHIGPKKIFSAKYKTFGKLSSAFRKNTAVFNSQIEEKIAEKGQKLGITETVKDASE
ncbi:AAA domain-containing protein [Aliivibrio fischeri]|uniref:McrB family protein n=1 Tax=Aliivibrio fischeri TaxID=668 RepID=UPI0012D95DB2|nr:AAA family ATPase [Aliivibrio fischeri]MUK62235.1 AAA domain-containing protein [Aliivibrio fischeri]MUK66796.1 AAA domain-containing protein [Aliivibrio fischeri]MUL21495.1 AAA domain-containing protein [Aliivibrio fischeri]MUL23482.1 AAA domain-containing protein [Aliivibrio fischeri]